LIIFLVNQWLDEFLRFSRATVPACGAEISVTPMIRKAFVYRP